MRRSESLQLGAQQFLLCLQRLRPALDELCIKGAAVLDLLKPARSAGLQMPEFLPGRVASQFTNQDLVVELMNR